MSIVIDTNVENVDIEIYNKIYEHEDRFVGTYNIDDSEVESIVYKVSATGKKAFVPKKHMILCNIKGSHATYVYVPKIYDVNAVNFAQSIINNNMVVMNSDNSYSLNDNVSNEEYIDLFLANEGYSGVAKEYIANCVLYYINSILKQLANVRTTVIH